MYFPLLFSRVRMHIFHFPKYCGKVIKNIEYSTSKACSQINSSSYNLAVFLVHVTDSYLDPKNKMASHICTFSSIISRKFLLTALFTPERPELPSHEARKTTP